MKIRGTVIITLMAAIIVLLYYFLDTKYFAKKEEKTNDVVINLNPSNIRQFEIVHPTYLIKRNESHKLDEKLIFERDEKGKWFIVKPKKLLADRNEIEMILDKFNPLTYTKKIDSVKNLKQFGLETPKIIITLWEEDSKNPTKILFGNENPTGDSIYFSVIKEGVKDDGLKVYLTSSYIKDNFEKDLNTLRDKTILSFKEEVVKKMEIKFKSDTPTSAFNISGTSSIIATSSSIIPSKVGIPTTYTFEKKGKEKWNLKTNKKIPNSEKEPEYENKINSIVENIILEVNDLKGKEVVDEQPQKLSEYGLDIPNIEITFILHKGERVLLCGSKKKEEGYYVKVDNRNEVFLIDTWKIDNIKKEIEKLK